MVDVNHYDFSYENCQDLFSAGANRINIKWTILGFRQLSEENTQFTINEKNYNSYTSDNLKFKLKIAKVLDGKEGEIFRFAFSPTPTTLFVKSNLFSGHGDSRKSLSDMDYVWVTKTKWTLLAAQLKSDVLESLCHDCLVLEYQFLVKTKPCNQNCSEISSSPLVSSLKNDLSNLLTNSFLSDVKVKSVDGVEVPAHKIILAARSAVFKAHLEHGTKECLTDVIDSPFETDVLQAVLDYIYFDKEPELTAMFEKLFTAADFYQLEGLKVFCEKKLMRKISVDNVIDILQFAELHSVNTLKTAAVHFIKSEHRNVIKSEAYNALESVEMIKRIHEYALQ